MTADQEIAYRRCLQTCREELTEQEYEKKELEVKVAAIRRRIEILNRAIAALTALTEDTNAKA